MPERASSNSQMARLLGDPRRYCGGKGGVGAHGSRTAGAAPRVEFQVDKRRDLVAARGLVWVAMSPFIGRALDSPLALLPNALCLAPIAWLVIDTLERWRVGPARKPLRMPRGPTLSTVAVDATVEWPEETARPT